MVIVYDGLWMYNFLKVMRFLLYLILNEFDIKFRFLIFILVYGLNYVYL